MNSVICEHLVYNFLSVGQSESTKDMHLCWKVSYIFVLNNESHCFRNNLKNLNMPKLKKCYPSLTDRVQYGRADRPYFYKASLQRHTILYNFFKLPHFIERNSSFLLISVKPSWLCLAELSENVTIFEMKYYIVKKNLTFGIKGLKTRKTTFIKTKFNKSDDETNIDNIE